MRCRVTKRYEKELVQEIVTLVANTATQMVLWCESTLPQRGPAGSFQPFNANLGVFEKFGWLLKSRLLIRPHTCTRRFIYFLLLINGAKALSLEDGSGGARRAVSEVSPQIYDFCVFWPFGGSNSLSFGNFGGPT